MYLTETRLFWGPQTRFNVFGFQALNNTKYDLYNTIGNAFIQFEPVTGLRLKGSLDGQYSTNLRKTFNDFDAWRFSQTPGNPYAGQDGIPKGLMVKDRVEPYNLNKELTLNYYTLSIAIII